MSYEGTPTLFDLPEPKPKPRYVVEVNEVGIFATGIGRDWWTTFLLRFDRTTDRIEWIGLTPQGGVARVACDDREHADWLRGHMVEHGGLHAKHLKVKKLSGGKS